MLKTITKYQHAVFSAILIIIRSAVGFGVQKLVAVAYGPVGTTLISHFQNLISIFTQPVQDVIVNGLINAFPKKDFEKSKIIGASLHLLLILLSGTAFILFLKYIFNESLFSFSFSQWVLIVISIMLFSLGLILSAIYVVERKLKIFLSIISFQWLLFFLIVLLYEFELNEFLLFWLIIQAIFTLILYLPIKNHFKINFELDNKIKNHFKQFLIIGFTVLISSKWVDYFVREYAVQEFGQNESGLWQAVVRLSEAYRGLIISFLFLTFYPSISKAISSDTIKSTILRKHFLLYLVLSLMLIIILFLFSDQLLTLLYNREYSQANYLFRLQLVGDFLAILSFPFAIYLLARVNTYSYIFAEILSAIVFIIVILLKLGNGIDSIVIAHICRFIIYSISISAISVNDLKNVSN